MSKSIGKLRLMELLGEVNEKFIIEAEYTEEELKNLKTQGVSEATVAIVPPAEERTEEVNILPEKTSEHAPAEVVASPGNNKVIRIIGMVAAVSLVAAAVILMIFLWNPDRSQIISTTEATDPDNTHPTEEITTTEVPPTTEVPTTEEPTTEDGRWNPYTYYQDIQRDLKGRTFTLVNWWGDLRREPKNQGEEDWYVSVDDYMDKCNFQIDFVDAGVPDEVYLSKLTASIAAGSPIGDICVIKPEWFTGLYNNHLLTPLDTLKSLKTDDPKWNPCVVDATSFGGHVYGVAPSYRMASYVSAVEESQYFLEWPSGIYFNKRLLQEAGLDGGLLYDLQKEGKWTWSKFEEILQACTRDTDNDGNVDTWGMVNRESDYFSVALYSSGSGYVTKDADGRYVDQMDSDRFLKYFTKASKLYQKYSKPLPAGEETSFKSAFMSGEAAMCVSSEFTWDEMKAIPEEWGFVLFPNTDDGELIVVERSNILVIPSSFSPEEADDIALAYNLYTNIPYCMCGYLQHWEEPYYSLGQYGDTRTVDDSLRRIDYYRTEGGLSTFRYDLLIPEFGSFMDDSYLHRIVTGDVTPEEAIQSKKNELNKILTDLNKQ